MKNHNPKKPLQVLLVEDSPSDAALLRENILSSGARGFSVSVATSLQGAVDHCKNNRPDALLLDLTLPDSSGIATVQKARDISPDLPIVVLTGLEDEKLGMETIQAGIQDYLVKGRADGPAITRAIRYAIVRVKSELALRESREDLNRAQAVAHIGSWRMDVRHNVLSWSDENHRIFGIPKGTPLTYESFLATIHPDDRDYVDRMWAAALKNEPYDIEHRIVVNGAIKWVHETAGLEFDGKGNLFGAFGTTQDITDIKKREQELDRLNRTLRSEHTFITTILQTTGGLIVVLDPEGRIKKFNSTCEKITGYTFEEVIDKPFWDFLLLPEDVEPVKAVFAKLSSGNFPSEFENYWLHRDGTRRFIRWTNSAILKSDGAVDLIVGTGIDITERKQMEDKLRYHASLVDNISEAAISTDSDYKILSWNRAAETMYGWRAEEVIGKSSTHILRTEYPAAVSRDVVVGQLEDRGCWKGEVIQRRKDGTPLNVAASLSLWKDGTVKNPCVIAINRDITGKKQAEELMLRNAEELRRNNEELERFNLAMVNREIRVIELKKQVNELCGRLGEPPRFPLAFEEKEATNPIRETAS